MLPPRDDASEDAFVGAWSEREDPGQLLDVIEAAIAARRPRLAARLVGLLSEQVDIEPGSPADRARRAARLVLHDAGAGAGPVWEEFEAAWEEARSRRMWRIRRRMRGALEGRSETVPRVGRRPRRR